MTSDDVAARLAARYPRPSRRRLILPITVTLAIALGAWILWAGLYRANPGITGQLHGYQVVSNTEVAVTVVVHRPDPQVVGLCVVQAKSSSGEVVGEVRLPIGPARSSETRHEATIKTYLRATTAIVTGCSRV